MALLLILASVAVMVVFAFRSAEASIGVGPSPSDTSGDENTPQPVYYPSDIWPTTVDLGPQPETIPPEEKSWDMGTLFSSWFRAKEAPVAGGSNDLSGTGLPESERAIILETASRFNIDARLLAALRRTENGGPGREFGVLSVSAPTYQEQANVAARTIANNLRRYKSAGNPDPIGTDGRVTPDFIRYFSAIYAPIGASNDPNKLNQNHVANLMGFYSGINYA